MHFNTPLMIGGAMARLGVALGDAAADGEAASTPGAAEGALVAVVLEPPQAARASTAVAASEAATGASSAEDGCRSRLFLTLLFRCSPSGF
jgi:hypothetical protein